MFERRCAISVALSCRSSMSALVVAECSMRSQKTNIKRDTSTSAVRAAKPNLGNKERVGIRCIMEHAYPKSLKLSTASPVSLIVHGQGVVVFGCSGEPCTLTFYNADKSNGLKVSFEFAHVQVTGLKSLEPFTDVNNKKGLSNLAGAYYWFSLDSQNQRFYAGVGEPRLETAVYTYTFSDANKVLWESNKGFLESLVSVELSASVTPQRLLRDPVTLKVPLVVKNTNELTMNDVAKGEVLPHSNLSSAGQQLYDCVSGRRFVLNDVDFPDFAKAIEYSIATPGLWCNTRLKEKANEFSKDKPNEKETYLRITLGENNGESPGVPYVMEIWPVGHFSPVHSHSSANAVIRVLHGGIHVSLFPFLSSGSTDAGGVEPFGAADFSTGDITWISPTLNQTHQLKNLDSNKDTCITIQCYNYDNTDKYHYDYFDYIDAAGKIQQYEPDSDMDFVKFKNLMKQEWVARPCNRWFY